MSDIPSALSKWEPSRAVKAAFMATAVASLGALYGGKIYTAYVVNPHKVELAMHAEPGHAQAPAFTLKDQHGKTVSLSDFRGKMVFVHFWATWCQPCREELPTLVDYARGLDPDDVVFLAVSADDAWSKVNTFYEQEQLGALPFRTLLDEDQKASQAYGVTGYPESYIVGRNGELLYKIIGPRDWTAIAAVKLLENAGARRLTVNAPPKSS